MGLVGIAGFALNTYSATSPVSAAYQDEMSETFTVVKLCSSHSYPLGSVFRPSNRGLFRFKNAQKKPLNPTNFLNTFLPNDKRR